MYISTYICCTKAVSRRNTALLSQRIIREGYMYVCSNIFELQQSATAVVFRS